MLSAMGSRSVTLTILVAISYSWRSAAAFSSTETSFSSLRSFAPKLSLSMTSGDPLSPLAKLKLPKNPFGSQSDGASLVPQPPDTPPEPLGDDPEAIFARARAVISSDLGVRDGSLLADNFVWVGPNVAETGALKKEEYLAAGKFFDLRSAFPDLDYRAHDFRLDEKDSLTVRVTARMVGTMRGELRLRTEAMPPNGKRLSCPPEAISITFDRLSGKVVKLCTGFTMDRLVGNTAGLCGVKAAATVAGAPPSEWEIYPPTVVLSRFFGRSVKQLEEPTSFLAPFPETVMIQLAKGVIAADNGASDPDLLAPSFTFCGPVVGPIGKKEFVEAFGSFKLKEAFPDLDLGLSNFRVDPYDPYRVWVDGRGSGAWTGQLLGKEGNGARYEGPPEAISLTFDDDGFCTRLTAGAVMDPTLGNTGGLGGVFGIFYATGQSLPGISTRPLPELFSRLQKKIVQPITGVAVDDFGGSAETAAAAAAAAAAPTKSPPMPKVAPPAVPVSPPKPPKALPTQAAKKGKEVDPTVDKAQKEALANTRKAAAQAERKRLEAEKKGMALEEAKRAAAAKAKQAEEKKREALEAKKAAAAKAKKAKKAEQLVAKAKPGASINLFGLGQKEEGAQAKKTAAASAKKAEQLVAKAKPGASINLFGLGQKEEGTQAKKTAAASAKKAQQVVANAKPGATIPLFAFGQKEKDQEPSNKAKTAADKKKREAEEKRKAVAAAAQEKKAAAAAAAERKKREAEEKRAAAAAAAVASKDALEQKRREAEEKRKAAAAAAQEKKAAAAAVAERKKREAEEKRAAAAAAAAAKKDALERKRREAEEKRKAAAAAAQEKKAAAAAAAEAKKAAAERKKRQLEGKRKALEAKKTAAANAKKAQQTLAKAKPGASIGLFFGQQKTVDDKAVKAKKAEETAKKAKPGATISLFGFGGKTNDSTSERMSAAPVAAAPQGMPSLVRWRRNFDGSVTGFISGSNAFEEGERITTSKIKTGEFKSGKVVETESGSKYFLV